MAVPLRRGKAIMSAFAYSKAEKILSIQNVNLEYNGRSILRDVNAEIRNITRPDRIQGQVVGFLGPSGIGKTQLARIIAGLQKQTSGSVYVGPAMQPAAKGLVGMVAQSYTLFPWTTVRGNLDIAGVQSGMAYAEFSEKRKQLLAEFELEKYLDMYPNQLSGGTRQRVAIVQQLLCSNHFLIMDEPFSGLDLIMKARACELITQVANLDDLNTIIVVTHDVTEAASISDTLWLMGRELDDRNEFIPGARLVECYDLAERDLCWHEGITKRPDFLAFVSEIKERFTRL